MLSSWKTQIAVGLYQTNGNDQGLENQSNTSGDEISRSRNEWNDKSTSRDDTDIRPSYDTEPMVDSNVIPDSPDMCEMIFRSDQFAVDVIMRGEAKKKGKLQKDKALNTKPSVQQSARLPNTANGNKPKPRKFNQQPRNWPPSMSSRVSNRTCKYNANHDDCILKYLSKVHSYASAQKKDAQSNKTTKRYMPIEKKCDSKKHDKQIPIGQKFSPNKSSNVYLKTTPPRSGLTWKPTGRIFTQVGLKWIPIRKSVETCYNTNDSASPLGKKTHNPNTTICANSSSLSADTFRVMLFSFYWMNGNPSRVNIKQLCGLTLITTLALASVTTKLPKERDTTCQGTED
ncbi:hypothetical protein Tco_0677506 [Tanacetum coccineum]|uniref:Uncharacterized protein n=1 Tax=Tanacetum coccineum TaxID=301880 RepID=A0ABQ4XCD1_9ASTR